MSFFDWLFGRKKKKSDIEQPAAAVRCMDCRHFDMLRATTASVRLTSAPAVRPAGNTGRATMRRGVSGLSLERVDAYGKNIAIANQKAASAKRRPRISRGRTGARRLSRPAC